MANEKFRKEIKQSGVKMWQIADKIGISEMTLSRKFRYELISKEKDEIRRVIAGIVTDPLYQANKSIIKGV
ncbi:MAG: hypothetical protein FWD71_21795 [Oscillospiraceae bacterium]|nr:hypothetical protein [Oscillospiraceae bacterium]